MTAVLRVADLDTAGRWIDVPAEPGLERRYRAVTGYTGAAPPAGLASVVARLAYTGGRVMPPGGVLREIAQITCADLPGAGAWQARVASTVDEGRSGRRRVTVTTEVRRGGVDVAAVRFVLDWPAGAP